MIFIGIMNSYWLAVVNVPVLGGNKFFNGIACGIAEIASGLMSGCIVHFTSARTAFQTCCIISAVSFTINQMFTDEGTIAAYITIFFTFCGVGGAYNLGYLLISLNVPIEQAGSVMNLAFAFSNFSSLGLPMINMLPQELIFLTQLGIITFEFIISFTIPLD